MPTESPDDYSTADHLAAANKAITAAIEHVGKAFSQLPEHEQLCCHEAYDCLLGASDALGGLRAGTDPKQL